jgi:hypothetical protein
MDLHILSPVFGAVVWRPLLNVDERKLVEDVRHFLLERLMDERWAGDLDAQDQQIIFDHVKQYD